MVGQELFFRFAFVYFKGNLNFSSKTTCCLEQAGLGRAGYYPGPRSLIRKHPASADLHLTRLSCPQAPPGEDTGFLNENRSPLAHR